MGRTSKQHFSTFLRNALQHNLVANISHESRFPCLSSSIVSGLGSRVLLIIFAAIMNNIRYSRRLLAGVKSQRSDLHFFHSTLLVKTRKASIDIVDALLMSHQPNFVTFRF